MEGLLLASLRVATQGVCRAIFRDRGKGCLLGLGLNHLYNQTYKTYNPDMNYYLIHRNLFSKWLNAMGTQDKARVSGEWPLALGKGQL